MTEFTWARSRPITGASESRARSPRDVALSRPLPERVDWSELGPEFFQAWGYPRGKFTPEHMEIIGSTGGGKSHFQSYILSERARLRGSRVIVICTKPADETLSALGWPVVDQWPPATSWRDRRRDYRQVLFWATAKGLGKAGQAQQAEKIEDLLERLWVPKSNVIVVFDEVAYVADELKLSTQVDRYFREGRSLGITAIATTQRPSGLGVRRAMHGNSSWTVFFAPKDEEDAERMAQIAGNKLYYRRALAELDISKFEFLMVHNTSRQAYISSLPRKPIPITIRGAVTEVPKRRPPVA